MPDAWQSALTAVVGLATGILSGLFGVGGAIVSTPAIRALGASPLESVGSTLPSIVPSALSGTYRYLQAGLVHARIVAWTASVGLLAVVGGALLTTVVPGNGHPLMIATALLVAVTAYRLGSPVAPPEAQSEGLGPDAGRPGARNPRSDDVASRTTETAVANPATGVEPRGRWWQLVVVGAGAGLLSGLLGIGGGLLLVPAFVNWIRVPLKEALGTSLACVGVLAVPGIVAHALLGHINWGYALPLCVGVVPGAQLGAHLAIRSPERALRLLVASVLGAIAAVYAAGEILALT